jgi:AcrR family transcriptional regulator
MSANRSRRDSERSRNALLSAAAELFAERGYAGTAIRSVGDRAGVDPALIARYYGGKEGLYQAVLATDQLLDATRGTTPPDTGDHDGDTPTDPVGEPTGPVEGLVERALARWRSSGVSAVIQNVFRREVDAAAREATCERLRSVILPPLRMAAEGPDAELRVELAAALLLGAGVARQAGALPRLAAASDAQIAGPLMAALNAALAASAPAASQEDAAMSSHLPPTGRVAAPPA